jgi:hypothetical protein
VTATAVPPVIAAVFVVLVGDGAFTASMVARGAEETLKTA